MEVLEGKTLPAFEILTRRAQASQTASAPAAGFDPQRGVEMMGSTTTLHEILQTAHVSLTASLPDIKHALAQGDVAKAKGLLHAIKGYAPIFCTDNLVAQIVDIEKLSKTATAAEITSPYAQLEPRLQSLLIEIQTYLSHGQQ